MSRVFGLSILVMLLMGVSGANAQTAAADDKKSSVTFKRTDRAAGERRVKSDTLELDIKIEAVPPEGEPEMLQQRVTEVMVYDEKVIEYSADKRVFEVRFKSVSKSDERTSKGTPATRKENAPVEGKAYLVSWTRAGGLSVKGLTNEIVPKEEADVILDEYKNLGDSSSFSEFLNGKTMAIGQTLEMSPEALSGFLKDDKDGAKQLAKGSVTLKEIRKAGSHDIAVFDFKIEMSRREGEGPNWLEMIVDLGGEVLVRIDGLRMLQMKMSGPVKFKGEQQGPDGVTIKLRGKGAMRGEGVKNYL